MRRVIFNQKGGVGKTSITCNLAACFAALGRKVLVIDMDSQANTSQYLLGDAYNENSASISTFFAATIGFQLFRHQLKDVLHGTLIENLWVIPAGNLLAELQTKLESRYKIFKLAEALKELTSQHDFSEILIDTPPALNFYTMSALIASERVLIPFDCDAFSVQALHNVARTVEEVREDHKSDLQIQGVIINNLQKNAKLPKQHIADLENEGFQILKPHLSSSVVMKESHTRHLPLAFMKPSHPLSLEYMELAKTVLGTQKTGVQKAGAQKRKVTGRSTSVAGEAIGQASS